jgi:hypothetical protein
VAFAARAGQVLVFCGDGADACGCATAFAVQGATAETLRDVLVNRASMEWGSGKKASVTLTFECGGSSYRIDRVVAEGKQYAGGPSEAQARRRGRGGHAVRRVVPGDVYA